MKFLTAKKGEAHFTSAQFRTILEAAFGNGSYVANLYEKLQAEVAANNTIKIRSGLLVHRGGAYLIEPDTYDEITYVNGTQGMKRIDLVVMRYTKDEFTGNEDGEWNIIQGEPTISNPVVPEYIKGNMQTGDFVDDCPVFEIHFDGLNIVDIKQLLSAVPSISELNRKTQKTREVKFNITLDENVFASPYTHLKFFYLEGIDFPKRYGQIVSVYAQGNAGTPIVVSAELSEEQPYFRVCGNGPDATLIVHYLPSESLLEEKEV